MILNLKVHKQAVTSVVDIKPPLFPGNKIRKFDDF